MTAHRQRLVELDKRLVWHPYTAMQEYIDEVDPLVIERAQGSRLFDVDGRSYLDGNASWWTCPLGHGHPRLIAALKAQAEKLCHVSLAGITHESAALLAERLIAVAPPGLTRVFFSDDGSTSVEAAIKLVLQYWAQNGRPKRRRFVALHGAFHGETLGAAGLSGVEIFRQPFADLLLDSIFVPPAENGYETAFAALERALDREADSIAAVVIEPLVQAASGMRIYDARYVSWVRELTQRHDVFLIADEVFSGYGRTGPMWAVDRASVCPDVLCTAKGFSGGLLPMAATLVSERLFEGFLGDRARAFFYGHTYCGNPLGARVALEVLRVYDEEKVLSEARPKAERIARAFAEMAELPGVARTRSLGMLGALDLSGTGGYLDRGGWRVYTEALRRGAYLRPLGNVVYVTPALNIPEQDLEDLLSIVFESVRAAA